MSSRDKLKEALFELIAEDKAEELLTKLIPQITEDIRFVVSCNTDFETSSRILAELSKKLEERFKYKNF